MPDLAFVVLLVTVPWLLYSGARMAKSMYKAGYSRGRLEEFLKMPRPEVEEDWKKIMKPLPPEQLFRQIKVLEAEADPEVRAEVEAVLK